MIINPYIFSKARALYGYLYNADASMDADMLPTDWGIPTHTQASDLVDFIDYYVGGEKIKLNSSLFWNLTTANTNDYNFSLLGAGYFAPNGEHFSLKEIGAFWVYDNPATYHWAYGASDDDTNVYDNQIIDSYFNEGHSIRAIYNGGGTPSNTITDYEGNVYDVININGQYWTAQNWKCKYLNDGTPLTRRNNSTEWSASSGKYYAPPNYNESYV